MSDPDRRSSVTFASLGLREELLRALEEAGYVEPTEIQRLAIPAILRGGDVLGCAQTGSGKTAGFLLPILERLSSRDRVGLGRRYRALVLAPTRELVAQIAARAEVYGKQLGVRIGAVFGGAASGPQTERMKEGVDLLIATPGRLLDFLERGVVWLSKVEVLVLDEADRMLDMGFFPDLREILRHVPKERQTLLFSATMPTEVENLIRETLADPTVVEAGPRARPVDRVEQVLYPVDQKRKADLLLHLLRHVATGRVLIFVKTRSAAEWMAHFLGRHRYRTMPIHGGRSQEKRRQALTKFQAGKIDVLVATDLAARGLDFQEVSHVINFDFPIVPEDYVHRIGRTARVEASGVALSLVCAGEMPSVRRVERLTKIPIRRQVIAGFEPRVMEAGGPARPAPPRPSRRSRKPAARRRESETSGEKPSGARPGRTGRDDRRGARKRGGAGASQQKKSGSARRRRR